MTKMDHLGYIISNDKIRNKIYIPKYYSPEIKKKIKELSKNYNFILLKDLINDADISITTGDEIGKMAYGTGEIPFIRTSDISNYEIKTDPKQGISQEIFNEYSLKQNVEEGDIFFVKDGTYLIGQSCIVTKYDLPCLFQSHIFKIRVNPKGAINSYLFFASINSEIVKEQVKSKQFTADIIDSIGNRITELQLPIPKSSRTKKNTIEKLKNNLNKRADLKDRLRRIPYLAQGLISNINEDVAQASLKDFKGMNLGFLLESNNIVNNKFIPKYYDPIIQSDLAELTKTHDCVMLKDLVNDDIVSWETGIEIGKMAYGTGKIPFIRTSDISNWELKSDPKQMVSEEIYSENKQDVKENDIFLVRDGTYLVGTSCIITKEDTNILYCGGLYKFRVENNSFDPYLFLTLLNTPIVKHQMRLKQFTRDIIDTLGKRIFEVILPIPRGKNKKLITTLTKNTIGERVKLRNQTTKI